MVKATAGKPDPMVDGMTREQRFFYGFAAVQRSNFTPQAFGRISSGWHPERLLKSESTSNILQNEAVYTVRKLEYSVHI